MAAWWAKAYEGLEVRLAASRRVCALLRCDAVRCEGSTGRAANGRLARSDSRLRSRKGSWRSTAGAGAGAGVRAGGGLGGSDRGEALARRDCRVLACVAGGCAVKELLRASRHGAAGGSSSGCGRRAAGALSLSLSLSPLGGRRGVPVWHQQTDLVASRCLESSVLAVRLGWLRSGYECDTTRGQGSGAVAVGALEELEAGAGGAGASTAVNEDQARLRPRPRPRRSAQRHKNEQ